MSSIYEKIGLARVVNASGRMTALGVSTIADETAETMKQAAQNYVVIDDLLNKAGEMITEFTGAEDTCVTSNTSAAMCLSIAGIMTGKDLSKVSQLPDTTGLKNEVIIQKGHCIDYGAPVVQTLKVSGCKVVEVGCANKVYPDSIIGAINENTCALFYVKSHHCVQKGMVSLEDMIKIAHDHNLPLVIDASAEEDLRKYIAMGADLVCYSGAKAIEGPTSGFVTGKKCYTDAIKLHYKGIGRLMKIGKENMMGIVKAVEIYSARNQAENEKRQETIVTELIERLSPLKGIKVSMSVDEAGRKIYRCRVDVLEDSKVDAFEIGRLLKAGNPSIHTRDHFMNVGTIFFDPRPMIDGDIDLIVAKMTEILAVNN